MKDRYERFALGGCVVVRRQRNSRGQIFIEARDLGQMGLTLDEWRECVRVAAELDCEYRLDVAWEMAKAD